MIAGFKKGLSKITNQLAKTKLHPDKLPLFKPYFNFTSLKYKPNPIVFNLIQKNTKLLNIPKYAFANNTNKIND